MNQSALTPQTPPPQILRVVPNILLHPVRELGAFDVDPRVVPADVAHGVTHFAEVDVALAVEAFEIFGVQLAKHLGAHVTAVYSATNASLDRSLSADEVIDYATFDFAAGGARFDVVLDSVGNAPYSRVKAVLAAHGRLLAVLADFPAMLGAGFAGRTRSHRVIAGSASEKGEDLMAVAELAAQGKLRSVIDRRFPFEEIVDAYRLIDSGRKKGSVVLSLGSRAELRE